MGQLLFCAKSPLFSPVMVIPLMDKSACPELLRTTSSGALVVPAACGRKFSWFRARFTSGSAPQARIPAASKEAATSIRNPPPNNTRLDSQRRPVVDFFFILFVDGVGRVGSIRRRNIVRVSKNPVHFETLHEQNPRARPHFHSLRHPDGVPHRRLLEYDVRSSLHARHE